MCGWSSRKMACEIASKLRWQVIAVGWVADTTGLNLAAAGVETDPRGYVQVDEYPRTSVPNIFAAADITGRLMLVPQAMQDGFVAATKPVRGSAMTLGNLVSPIGSFTKPEYSQVGLSEGSRDSRSGKGCGALRRDPSYNY